MDQATRHFTSNADACERLAALHQRYDGTIPDHERMIARLGSGRAVLMLQACGQVEFFRLMVKGQVRAMGPILSVRAARFRQTQ